MKCRALLYVLILILLNGTLQAQNKKYQNQDYCIIVENVRITLGMQVTKLEPIKKLLIYSEKLHKDYGPLIWKSSEIFVPDSNYDILIYTDQDIEIQAYRGRGKVNLIIFKSDKYHVYDYWIGKNVNIEALIRESNYRNKNTFMIPVFDNNDEVGVLQITLLSNKIDKMILTSRL